MSKKLEIIPDRAFKALAKAIDDAPARKSVIKGLNEAGKSLRRDAAPLIIANVVPTAKSNLGLKSKAASEHRSGEPNYTIRFRGSVPVSRLKASARKFKKGRLSLDFPGVGDDLVFSSARKAGRGSYRLNKAGDDLPERGVGPVGYRTRFRNSRELKARLKQAGDEAAAAILKELVKSLGGR